MRAAILFGLPLAIMLFSIVVSTGSATAKGQPAAFSGSQQQTQTLTSISCNSLTVQCLPSGSTQLPPNSVISCTSTQALPGYNSNACLLIAGVCTLGNPSQSFTGGVFCATTGGLFSPSNTYLESGASATISQQSQPVNSNNAIFNFASIGPTGFIAMVAVIIAVAVFAGFSILGSGLNSESIRLLAIGGFFVGLWAIMTAADGFLTGSQGSLFTQANLFLTGAGSILYIICSLLWVIGTVTTMSSGGGGA